MEVATLSPESDGMQEHSEEASLGVRGTVVEVPVRHQKQIRKGERSRSKSKVRGVVAPASAAFSCAGYEWGQGHRASLRTTLVGLVISTLPKVP